MSDLPTPPPAPFAVVLVRPQEAGNVGAVARAMANMGLAELVLVEPAVELDRVARAFAVKAHHILDGARRAESLAAALAPFERVVATTSSRSRQQAAPLLGPRQLAERLATDREVPTALVFGPESSGLTVEELAVASLLVRIPCAPEQPTLNLAQAVLVVAYEIYQARLAATGGAGGEPPGPEPAAFAEVEGLFAQLEPLLAEIGFARDDTYASAVRDLRRLAARSALSRREVAILRGICRRAGWALRKRRGGGGAG